LNKKGPEPLLVFLNKRNDALTEILGDVLRLIPKPPLVPSVFLELSRLALSRRVTAREDIVLLVLDLVEDVRAVLDGGITVVNFLDIWLVHSCGRVDSSLTLVEKDSVAGRARRSRMDMLSGISRVGLLKFCDINHVSSSIFL
jgi:hypothetical protein